MTRWPDGSVTIVEWRDDPRVISYFAGAYEDVYSRVEIGFGVDATVTGPKALETFTPKPAAGSGSAVK